MTERRFERHEIFSRAFWDFFSQWQGSRRGLITNLSRSGCLLRTGELIEHRRWVRLFAAGRGNVHVSLVGRVTRCENVIESTGANGVTLFRHGIEFTQKLEQEPIQLFEPAPLHLVRVMPPERSARWIGRS